MPTHYNPQLEEEKKRREEKIAKSQASASPIQQAGPMQAPGMGPQQQSPLAQMGMQVGKQLLGSALGPLGGVLGGLFNEGGKVDYAEEARKRVAAQNAAIKAGVQGQNVAPLQRRLFDEQGNPLGQVSGDAIKGYADREKFVAPQGQDTYAGIGEQIQAAKAAGEEIDYNALAALQRARQSGNEQEKQKAMQAFLAKHPNFRMPGGSQGVVFKERNMGGPISMKYPAYNKGGKAARPWWMKILDRAPAVEGKNMGGMMRRGPLNPNGYNEGGAVQQTPIKKVMDEQKLDQQAKAFELDEMRKQEKHQLDMKLKQQQFQQAQQMKKAAATTNKTAKAPLAKK